MKEGAGASRSSLGNNGGIPAWFPTIQAFSHRKGINNPDVFPGLEDLTSTLILTQLLISRCPPNMPAHRSTDFRGAEGIPSTLLETNKAVYSFPPQGVACATSDAPERREKDNSNDLVCEGSSGLEPPRSSDHTADCPRHASSGGRRVQHIP